MTLAELVVKFRADTATFATDVGKIKHLSFDSSKHIAQSFKSIGMAVAAAAASLTAMGAAMVMNATRSADEMMKLSRSVGLGVETLSSYAHAARLSGLDLQMFATNLGRLARNAAEAIGKTGEASKAFKRLGIDVRDSQGHLRPTSDLILDVAEKFSAMEDSSTKTALAIQLFGRSGAAMINFLNQGREGLKAASEEARKLGLVIDEDTGRAAEEFRDNLERLEAAGRGFGLALMKELLPQLVNFSAAMVEMTKQSEGFRSEVSVLVWSLKTLATAALYGYSAIVQTGASLWITGSAIKQMLLGNFEQAKSIAEWGTKTLEQFEARINRITAKIWEEKPLVFPKRKPGWGADEWPSDEAAKAAQEAAQAQERYNETLARLKQELSGVSPAIGKYLDTLRDLEKVGHGIDTTQARMIAKQIMLRDQQAELTEEFKKNVATLGEISPAMDKATRSAIELVGPTEAVKRILAGAPYVKTLADDFQKLGYTMAELREEIIRVFVLGLPESLDIAEEKLKQFRDALIGHISGMEVAIVSLKEIFRGAFGMIADTMGHAIAQAIIYQKTFADAMAAALKAALAMVAGQLLAKAILWTAEGFAALALGFLGHPGAFKAAAHYFTAAGIAGGAAAGVAALGRAVPGGEGLSQPVAVSGAGGTVAGVVTSPAVTEPRAATVQIYFQGPVYGGQAGIDELVRDISDAVQNRDLNLVARRSKLPPYATHS